jgi:hypothetical protein
MCARKKFSILIPCFNEGKSFLVLIDGDDYLGDTGNPKRQH